MMGLMSLALGCPHGTNSTPSTCSQCCGARPRVVTIDGTGLVRIDDHTLGTLRELNDRRRDAESGIRRPQVRDDQVIFATRGVAVSRRRGVINSKLVRPAADS